MPHFYSAYQIYEANQETQQWKFYNWVNMTNQDAVGLYPQFMYEAILKSASKNVTGQELTFKVKNTPFPVTNEVRKRKDQGNAAVIIFMSSVAYGMLLTTITGHVVHERVTGIKHQQLISGMNPFAYWVANFVVDLAKMWVTVAATVICFYYFNLKYHTAWRTYIAFPVGAIPFSYVVSWLYQSVSLSQTITMFLNFGLMLFGSTVIFYLRWMPE